MQKNEFTSHTNYKRGQFSKNLNVAVPQAGLTTIGMIEVSGYDRLVAQMKIKTASLGKFVISGRVAADSEFTPLFSSRSHFLQPQGLIVGVTGDLTNQSVGTTGCIILDVRGFHEFKFEAASGIALASVVDFYGRAI